MAIVQCRTKCDASNFCQITGSDLCKSYAVINAYAQSQGEEIRIVAGAVNGGSAGCAAEFEVAQPSDFRGKRIAVPEFQNTQDVSARAWLAGGVRDQSGGEVAGATSIRATRALPVEASRCSLDRRPWVARLELLADGEILVDESNAITTVLVSSARFLTSQRGLVGRFVNAHRELTDWIGRNPAASQRMISEELLIKFKSNMTGVVLARGWQRIQLTNSVSLDKLQDFVDRAKVAGYFRSAPDLSRLIDMP